MSEGYYPYIGGGETRYYEISRRLADRHEVHVFTVLQNRCVDGKTVPSEEMVEGVHVHRYAYDPHYFKANGTRGLISIMRFAFETYLKLGGDFDVVVCSEWPHLHVFPAWLKKKRCPLVIEWHEIWEKYWMKYGVIGAGGMLVERLNPHLANHHVCVSEFTRHRLIRFYGCPEAKVTVISNGVDLNFFRGISAEKSWGKIVYVGRLVPHKHVDWLIRAFRKLERRVSGVELHIIGTGPELNRLLRLPRSKRNIFFHGYLSRQELAHHLKSAWIHVLPSVREGQGIVCLEAMACQTPTVAVEHPLSATMEIVKHGWNGLLSAPTINGLTNAMNSLLNNEELYAKIQENERSFIENFDWNHISHKTESLYQTLCRCDWSEY